MASADFALSNLPNEEQSQENASNAKRNRNRKRNGSESCLTGALKIDLICSRHKERLFVGLNEIFSARSFTDVIIVVGDQHFDAHRIILASTSEFFRFYLQCK